MFDSRACSDYLEGGRNTKGRGADSVKTPQGLSEVGIDGARSGTAQGGGNRG